LRDFSYEKYGFGYFDDFTKRNSNFKVDRLHPSEKKSPEVNSRLSQILKTFESTGIFTLLHPGKNLTQSYQLSSLDEDFIVHTKEFVKLTFSDEVLCHTKKVRGSPVTGNNFGKFVQHWAPYFTSPDIPRMQDIMQTTTEIQLRSALHISRDYFVTAMDEFFKEHNNGVENEPLEAKCNEVEALSYTVFQNL